jgi:hypothetical protein
VMPYLGGGLDYSNPVTDITDDRLENSHSAIHPARILVGERSYFGDCGSLQDGSSAHQARVLEYVGFSGFPPTGSLFLVGDELFSPDLRNCAGGVAYESDGDVWSTGDALDLHYLSGQPCHVAYGIERIPGSGNALSPESGICNLIDLDEYTGYYNKSQPGDVEVVHFPFSDWENLPAVCGGDVWAACPCDNPGGPDRGCANSLTPAGALLFSLGTTSVSGDSVVLQAQDMPNSTALYFQGTTVLGGGAGQPFGDGLRCAGGAVIRLGTKANVAGASQYPAPGDLPVSVRGQVAPGDLRIYQVWYRNAAAFCTPATFNLTNAIGGVWTP